MGKKKFLPYHAHVARFIGLTIHDLSILLNIKKKTAPF